MFFSVITKKLFTGEILTKNLVTSKRWKEVKGEKFESYGGSLKNPNFRGRVLEKPIYRGELPKNRGLTKKWGGGVVFERGIPQCTCTP